MLSKKLGVYQWLSLVILMTGVAFVQVTIQNKYTFPFYHSFKTLFIARGEYGSIIYWNMLILTNDIFLRAFFEQGIVTDIKNTY